MNKGGAIAAGGRILATSLSDPILHPRLVDLVRDERFIHYKASDINARYELDIKALVIRPTSFIFFLFNGVNRDLIQDSHSALHTWLRLESGVLVSLGRLTDTAFTNHFTMLYQ